MHLTPHPHHFNTPSNAGQAQFVSHFRHHGVAPMSGHALDGGAARGLHPSANLLPHDAGANVATQHVTQAYYQEPPRSAITPSTPSTNASPRFSNITPNHQPRPVHQSTVPTDRALPDRDVSDENIANAYAAFILYCNPSFQAETDTAELKKAFRTPPKSEGKSFSIYSLYELIRRLDAKEIKTWTELALELGVERPDVEKGQSTQKVQQYTVRLKVRMLTISIHPLSPISHSLYLGLLSSVMFLMDFADPVRLDLTAFKPILPFEVYSPMAILGQILRAPPLTFQPQRWMRALHIDAFFEYLVGKNPTYCRQIPPIEGPHPDQREGVPIEEDLAIRALDPKFRPKRGRRKADEHDDDGMEPGSAIDPKRPHLDTSIAAFGSVDGYPHSAHPGSAMPMTAHPDDMMSAVDPWSAAAAGLTPSGQLKPVRWRLGSEDPRTPHPMSAMTPMSAQPPDSAFDNEPHSAVTPSSARHPKSRRRHGPAVSSAWPSSNTTPSGRLRGRPPSNRSIRDGPFVTFPANPNKGETTIEIDRSKSSPERPRAMPATQGSPPQQIPTPISATPSQATPATAPQSRPGLQLQVPQHVGGPVHLVTPTVLVNGEMSPPQPTIHLPSASTASMATATSMRSGASGSTYFSVDASIAADGEHTFLTPRSATQGTPLRSASIPGMHRQPPQPPTISNEDLKRALAADLLRADLTGRGGKRLRGSEAKDLAEALLSRLRSPQPQHHQQPAQQPSAFPAPDAFNTTSAAWLGLSQLAGLPQLTGSAKKIFVQRYRVGRDGYDSPIDDDDDQGEAQDGPPQAAAEGEVRETFDIEWTAGLGALAGTFAIKGLSIGGWKGEAEDVSPRADGGAADEASAVVWKQRFLAAERKLRDSRDEVGRLKERVLDVVL